VSNVIYEYTTRTLCDDNMRIMYCDDCRALLIPKYVIVNHYEVSDLITPLGMNAVHGVGSKFLCLKCAKKYPGTIVANAREGARLYHEKLSKKRSKA